MRGENLEIAEAHERRRDAADDGARLGSADGRRRTCRAPPIRRSRHEAQRPRGRHAEVMHGLAAHELAHRGAQHRAAVGGARIRRPARPLELQVVARAVRAHDFAERDGAAIAELPRPVAELVSAVARRVRLHAGQHAIAAEHLGDRAGRTSPGGDDAQHFAHRIGPGQQSRRSAPVSDRRACSRRRAPARGTLCSSGSAGSSRTKLLSKLRSHRSTSPLIGRYSRTTLGK